MDRAFEDRAHGIGMVARVNWARLLPMGLQIGDAHGTVTPFALTGEVRKAYGAKVQLSGSLLVVPATAVAAGLGSY